LKEFEAYGRAWVRLIEQFGGVHHGFFLPRAAPGNTTLSFPGVGHAGPGDIAVAVFGFPDENAYNCYRAQVGLDAEGASIIERFADPPFTSYERIFLSPLTTDV
jgi:hypothetical protein